MEIKILKDGGKIAFQGEVNSLEELKSLFTRIKQQDEELGYSFTYEIPDVNTFVISILNNLTDQYFYQTAQEHGGYKNMGEIINDAQEGDPDAQFLKNLYDAIWAKEEELEDQLNSMTLEELLNLDLQKWAFSQYDQIKSSLDNSNN